MFSWEFLLELEYPPCLCKWQLYAYMKISIKEAKGLGVLKCLSVVLQALWEICSREGRGSSIFLCCRRDAQDRCPSSGRDGRAEKGDPKSRPSPSSFVHSFLPLYLSLLHFPLQCNEPLFLTYLFFKKQQTDTISVISAAMYSLLLACPVWFPV